MDTKEMYEQTRQTVQRVQEMKEAVARLLAELSEYEQELRRHLLKQALRKDADASSAESDGDDRRAEERRKGMPVPLQLSYFKTGSAAFPGWVVDCSQSGVGITTNVAISAGTTLSVRPKNAPARVQWIDVEVRNCHKDNDRWVLGCRFIHELPVEDLDLFRHR